MTERPFPAYKGDDPYIFVSYAHDDTALVYPEITRLRDQGFSIWYDEGIAPGSTWSDEVALALTESKLFVYFVTPRSVDSENCQQELNFALSRERKILAVHLVETQLSIGIELRLSNKQAIVKPDLSESAYETKLDEAVRALLPGVQPISLPDVIHEKVVNTKSIAILPFTNRNLDVDNDYLCDGIAEELIIGLSKIEDLTVVSQLLSFGLKGQNLDMAIIGSKLKVANVLTGSIQKSGERVRIAVILSEVETGSTIWSERYDGTLADVFELQEDVARQIIGALKVELGGDVDALLIDAGTTNAVAYQHYLLGRREYHKATRQSYLMVHEHFGKAVEIDPEFGRAYWWDFMTWFFQQDNQYVPQSEMYPKAKQVVERMNQTKFEPPLPKIWIERWLDRSSTPDEKTQAKEALEKVRSGDKDWHGFQFSRLGNSLVSAGLLNGGLEYLAYYLEHSSAYAADTWFDAFYGNLLFALGRFDKAIDHFSNVLARKPDAVQDLATRAMLYSRTGQYAKADTDLKELAKTFPRNFAQFYDLYWRRELDAARAYFDWMDGQRNLLSIFKIWGCFLLGYTEKGLDYLEVADNYPFFLRLTVLYPLTPSIIREVTSHPRYQALLAAHGLDDAWRDELMSKVNELEPITGIHVSLDEDY